LMSGDMFVLDFHEDRNIALSLHFNRHLSVQICSPSYPGQSRLTLVFELGSLGLTDVIKAVTLRTPGHSECYQDLTTTILLRRRQLYGFH